VSLLSFTDFLHPATAPVPDLLAVSFLGCIEDIEEAGKRRLRYSSF